VKKESGFWVEPDDTRRELEQQCFQRAFGLSEQQQPEQPEQQHQFPAGAPLSPAKNKGRMAVIAEQAAFRQKRFCKKARAFAKQSRAFLLVQRKVGRPESVFFKREIGNGE
jgi:hypothetical protein